MEQDISILWDYLAAADPVDAADLLFCFGSAHLGTARRAARLYAAGVAPHVLVTGGPRGRMGHHATEADAFAEVLIDAGVPQDAVVVERSACHTGENVVLGMHRVLEHGLSVRRVGIVAFPTSLRRCRATFRRHFPGVEIAGVPSFHGRGPYEGRPGLAARACLGEVRRLCHYPTLGYVAPEPIPRRVLEAAYRLEAGLGRGPADRSPAAERALAR